MWFVAAWLGCTGGETDTDPCALPDLYAVAASTDPDPPVAGEQAQLTLTVTRGCYAVQDLQQTHERMVHTFVISDDLQSFQHVHQEDFTPITADNLRTGTFAFPVTFPFAGESILAFDYASENKYLQSLDRVDVVGEPAQLGAPVIDLSGVATDRDVTATLVLDVAPVAGEEAAWHVHLTDAEGADVTDVTPWLGADAHAALISTDLAFVGHTHAYVEGMANVPPGHEMPHLYDGPDIPFRYTFSAAGVEKTWVQFARVGAPDAPYTIPLMFEVGD
jgi:hypothetical protein